MGSARRLTEPLPVLPLAFTLDAFALVLEFRLALVLRAVQLGVADLQLEHDRIRLHMHRRRVTVLRFWMINTIKNVTMVVLVLMPAARWQKNRAADR